MRSLLGLGLLLGLLCALPAVAELRRVEAVGAVPAGADAPKGVPIRRAALQAALREAVFGVGAELAGGLDSYTEPLLSEALGKDPSDFVVRYRIKEDRGERRPLLIHEPGVTSEYVVLAEADVDVGRVRQQLAAVGLIQRERPSQGHHVLVVLEDLISYPALAALEEQLRADPKVASVLPMEFVQGQAWLAVETSRSAAELLQRISRRPPEGVEIVPLGADEGRVHLRLVPHTD
jgi:hypothetical protein